jgi:hypothetical protein
MKTLFFTLLILFSVPLLANDNWVYTYNDATILKAVFNYLAMIKADKTYQTLLEVSIASGILVSALMKRLSPYSTMTTFAGTTLLITGIFAATTTVHVMNVKTYNSSTTTSNNYAAIDNVPYLMAFLTSTFSTVGYGTARTIENTLHVATDSPTEYQSTSFLNAGMNGSFKLYEGLNKINFSSISEDASELMNLYKTYNKLCINEIAYSLNNDAVFTLIVNSKNLLSDLNPESSNPIINVVKNEKVDTKFGAITCGELYKKTEYYKNNLLSNDNIINAVKERFKNFTGDAIEATSSVTSLYAGAQGNNPQEKLKNYMLANAFMYSFNAPWTVAGTQGGYASGLAIAQTQQMGQVNAQTASIMIPAMHSIMQALIYVSFPIIFLVMVASGNFQVLSIYIKTLLWIELWVPNFSILNFFIEKEAASKALDKMLASSSGFSTQDPLTLLNLANQTEVYSTIATQGAVAANMLWSVPMLAGFMMFGSFHSLMGMGSSLLQTTSMQGQIDNQLEQKNLAAAADKINEGIRNKNPLYTGDIGDAVGMQKYLNSTDSLSKIAAANALGLDKYTEAKMGESTFDSGSSYAFIDSQGSKLFQNAMNQGVMKSAEVNAASHMIEKFGEDGMTKSKFYEQVNGALNNTNEMKALQDYTMKNASKIGDKDRDGDIDWIDGAAYKAENFAKNQINTDQSKAVVYNQTSTDQISQTAKNTTAAGFLSGTVDYEKYIDAQKLKIEKELGEASAATSIAAITGQSRESWINSSAHFKAAQDAGNINAMTKIAEDTTGKKGDEAIKTFQEMQSRTGVSYTKDGWTFKDSWGENGQLVNRHAQQTTDKGVVNIDYDPRGKTVNYSRMNADKVDESKTWDLSYNVKGAQERLLRQQQEYRNLGDEDMKKVMFAKALADETQFSIEGAKGLINNLLTGVNTEIRNILK